MKKPKRKKCKKTVGPHRKCGAKASAEVRARRGWQPICRKHAAEFRSLFGELSTHFRVLR